MTQVAPHSIRRSLSVKSACDFAVENHGSIFLLRPLSENARAWAEGNIGQQSGYQPYWPTIIIEHRYVQLILEGAQRDGLVCR